MLHRVTLLLLGGEGMDSTTLARRDETSAVETARHTAQGCGGERGATTVLVASVCLLVILIGGGIALSAARQELYRAMDYKDRTYALMLAEAAMEDAAVHLDEIQDWSALSLPHDAFLGYQPHGQGYYQARLLNNADDPGMYDTDNALRILAKGYGRNLEYAVTVEGMYRRIGFDLEPLSVLTVCGNDIFASVSGSSLVSGYDHAPPPSPCSGSNCNPERLDGPFEKGGIFFEEAGRSAYLGSSSVVEGDPDTASGVPELQGDKGFCAQARLISEFMYRLPMPERITTWPANSQETYGTIDAPKLVYVAQGTELDLNGTTQGAGVLLIDGTVVQTGTFTFSGLIVVGRNARILFKGTANLFGACVTAGGYPNDPAWMVIGGNLKLVWCEQALQVLRGIMMPGLWYSWREYHGPEQPYPDMG